MQVDGERKSNNNNNNTVLKSEKSNKGANGEKVASALDNIWTGNSLAVGHYCTLNWRKRCVMFGFEKLIKSSECGRTHACVIINGSKAQCSSG